MQTETLRFALVCVIVVCYNFRFQLKGFTKILICHLIHQFIHVTELIENNLKQSNGNMQ